MARMLLVTVLCLTVVFAFACAGGGGKLEGKIAFTWCHGKGENQECGVYVINADGSAKTNLAGNQHVYLMTADGSEVVQLTDTRGSDGGAQWSPDGSRIAFSSGFIEPPGEAYAIDVDGSALTDLGQGGSVTWSPDGTQLAVHLVCCGGTPATFTIHVVNPDGSGQNRLTSVETRVRSGPVWSPDGERIAFAAAAVSPKTDDEAGTDVYIMNADGSNLTRLTRLASRNRINVIEPTWSPDGAHIVFAHEGDIYVIEADGSNLTNITNSPDSDDGAPSWSPR